MLFQFEVIETVSIRKIYTVEADSESEAREMAESGDTVREDMVRYEGVISRDVDGEAI